MTRQRIEEIRDTSLDYGLGVYIPIHELRELCTLALQAMPVVEWESRLPLGFQARFGDFYLCVIEHEEQYQYTIYYRRTLLIEGRAESWEAAKAAAEEALAKLWGGGE